MWWLLFVAVVCVCFLDVFGSFAQTQQNVGGMSEQLLVRLDKIEQMLGNLLTCTTKPKETMIHIVVVFVLRIYER